MQAGASPTKTGMHMGINMVGLSVIAVIIGQSAENNYYARKEQVLGIEIKAGTSVDPAALGAAKRIITTMLRTRPDIGKRMKDAKAALAIIPRTKFITDLPEFKEFSGKNDPNGNPYDSFKVRGAGGTPARPVTAVAEENLLGLKNDAFSAENLCVHEFAHAIMNLGFSDEERSAWNDLYDAGKSRNTFPGAFAMSNADEYWAELSQSYFNLNNEINGQLVIRQRDPEAFKFLESVYRLPPPKPKKSKSKKSKQTT